MDTNKIREALATIERALQMSRLNNECRGEYYDGWCSQALPLVDQIRAELDKAQQPDSAGLRYRSECSGLWYVNREAAGDVDSVQVDGVVYVSNKQGEMFDKRRELTDEEAKLLALIEFPISEESRIAYEQGLIDARDNYGIGAPAAGLTVDEVMEALQEHIDREGWAMTEPNRWRFRTRLTAAIEAKKKP